MSARRKELCRPLSAPPLFQAWKANQGQGKDGTIAIVGGILLRLSFLVIM